MNPMFIMQIKNELEKFHQRHPKFPLFFRDTMSRLEAGNVLEISLTSNDGNKTRTNIRITEEDKEFLQNLLSSISKQ